MTLRSLVILALTIICAGCATREPVPGIQYIILMELNDPQQADAVAHDAFRLLFAGPQRVIAGPRIDMPNSDADPRYHVGITVSFLRGEHYTQFINSPIRRDFHNHWRPHCKSILIATYGPTCEPDEDE